MRIRKDVVEDTEVVWEDVRREEIDVEGEIDRRGVSRSHCIEEVIGKREGRGMTLRPSLCANSTECVEGVFSELRKEGVLRS